jgi:hypothetical protein
MKFLLGILTITFDNYLSSCNNIEIVKEIGRRQDKSMLLACK